MGLRFIVFSLPHNGSTLPCLPETAGLVGAPPPQGCCCCCWAAAAAAWCCGCELPVSAGLLLAMLQRKEGGREEGGEGAKLDLALRDNGPGPYSMERRRERGAAPLRPSPVREGDEDADKWTPGGEQRPRRWPRELTAEGEPAARERDLFRQLPLGTRWRDGGSDATRPSVPRVAGGPPETPRWAGESGFHFRRASCA